MKKSLSLVLIIVLAFSGITCKKRKAEKTLRGSWNIYSYNATVYDECTETLDSDFNSALSYGTAEFERKDFTMTYALNDFSWSDLDCTPDLISALSGRWNVTEHDRELIVIHNYTVELDGQIWTANFNTDERASGKADGQDFVTLSRNTIGGGQIELYMQRKN